MGELVSWRIGESELVNWRACELVNWRVSELASWCLRELLGISEFISQ